MAEGSKKTTNKGLVNQVIPGTTLRVVREYTIESKTGRNIQKVACQCLVCRHFPKSSREEEYDLAKLKSEQSMCRVCVQRITDSRRTGVGRVQNFNSELATLYYHEQEILNGVLKPGLKAGREYINTQSIKIFKSIPEGFEVGSVLVKRDDKGALLYKYKVIGYKGVYVEGRRQGEPTEIILKCLMCYGAHLEEISLLGKDSLQPCGDCKSKKLMSRNLAYKGDLGAPRVSKPQSPQVNNSTRPEVTPEPQVNKAEENAAKFAEVVKKVNKNCYVYGYVKDKSLVSKVVCSACGYARGDFIYDSSRKDWNLGECAGCAKKAQDPLFRGKYKRDYVGKVFNGLEIIAQRDSTDGFLCDVRCICRGTSKDGKCGRVRTMLPLHEVIAKNIFCECGRLAVHVECEGYVLRHGERVPCENVISVMAKDINKNGTVYCKVCRNYKVTKEDFEKKVAFKDAEDSFKNMDERLKKESGVGETSFNIEDNLIVSKNKLYVGVASSQGYWRAACLTDNMHLTLSEEEVLEFDCDKHCHNVQQKLLPDILSKQVQSQLKL